MEGLFKGRWYRSPVKLEGETINPISPFGEYVEEYDPFNFYYPVSELRQGQKSLYLEFLSVNSDDPEAVRRFCEKFGCFELNTDFVEEEKSTQRIMSETILRKLNLFYFGKRNKTQKMPDMKVSWVPMKISTFRERQKAWFYRLNPPVKFAASPTDQKEELATFLTEGRMRGGFLGPELNWNVQNDRYEISWSSWNLEGYFCLMAMWDLLGPGKIIPCPHCQNVFLTASDRTKFCSATCYNSSKIQKYQKKKKEEKVAAQKNKKAKTTKSTGKKK